MKKKIIGFIIIFIGLFSLIIYYIFANGLFSSWIHFWKKTEEITVVNVPKEEIPEKKNVVENDNQIKKIINFENINKQVEDKKNVQKEFSVEDLTRLASSFAERFGSYSNQSDYSNVEDLKIYMTEKMKFWVEGYVADHRGVVSDTQNYFGITTKTIDSQVIEFDETAGTAKIKVVCRRRESQNTLTNSSEVYSQNVFIVMIKEHDSWKVDSAFWEDK